MSEIKISAHPSDCQSSFPQASLAADVPQGKHWEKAKKEARLIASIWSQSENQKIRQWAIHIAGCAQAIAYHYQPVRGGGYRRQIIQAKLCRNRNCPICQWRRSLKMAEEQGKALQALCSTGENVALMLTLTIKNCDVSQLRESISGMVKGWGKLVKRVSFSGVSHWVRSVEITQGKRGIRGETHPHMHTMLICPRDMAPRVLTQDWASEWATVCNLDYDPVTDIRLIDSQEGGIREVLKYAVKPSATAAVSGWLELVALQISGLRLFAASQSLKKYRLSDEMAGDAADQRTEDVDSHVDDLPVGISPKIRHQPAIVYYRWVSRIGHYMRSSIVYGMTVEQYRYSQRIDRGERSTLVAGAHPIPQSAMYPQ